MDFGSRRLHIGNTAARAVPPTPSFTTENTMTLYSYAAHYPHTCNKALYVAMALLFGSFGIHKFCCGRILAGIIYLALCWTFIPGVLGIIEGILAAFKPTDDLGAIVV